MNTSLIFSIISAVVTLGGVFIAVGVFKGKINENAECNKVQSEQIKNLASKDELARAVNRSDEMLKITQLRAEEDRAKGQGQWREFHGILTTHTERLGVLETRQNTLLKSLDELKADIKNLSRDLREELKELRPKG